MRCFGWCWRRWGPWFWNCELNSSSRSFYAGLFLVVSLSSSGCFVLPDLASWVAGSRCFCLVWFRNRCCSLPMEHCTDQSALLFLFECHFWFSPFLRWSSFPSRIWGSRRIQTLDNKHLQWNSNPSSFAVPSSPFAFVCENLQFSSLSASPNLVAFLDRRCWILTHVSLWAQRWCQFELDIVPTW